MTAPEFAFPPLPDLRTVTVSGHSVGYYDVGSGPALVLLHGIGGDADEWVFCFEPLSRSHRVIALDLPGFGRSDKPAMEYTVAAFVDFIEQFLKELHLNRVHLLGESLGGWIASAFALKFPQLIDKLILVDAAGVWGDITTLPIDVRVSTREHLRDVFRLIFYNKELATDALVDYGYYLHLERGDGATIDSLLRNTPGERLDGVITGITLPTLIVWGEHDEMIPLRVGQNLHRLIPGSKLVVIPECGHVPELEKPEELVKAVLGFLQ